MLKTHAVNAFEIHPYHQLANAAGFIQANMPLGKGSTLSEQEAWDVAAFINSHECPQGPHFTKSVAETRKKHHDIDDSLYGKTVNRYALGSHLKWSLAQALQTRAGKNSAGSLKRGAVKKISCRCNEAICIGFQHSVAGMLLSAK